MTEKELQNISSVTPEYEPYKDDEQHDWSMPEANDFEPESYDGYILSQVLLPWGD